jgi:uncharacterized protein
VVGCGSEKPEATPPVPSVAPASSVVPATPKPVETKAIKGNPNRAYQLDSLATTEVKAGKTVINSWVMDSEGKRQEGMMFLTDKDVKDTQGMLFVFSDPQPNDGKHGFWMHNTILPLDIIYISADKRVLNIQAGKPHDDTSLTPAGTYMYTLELKQGMAKKLGLKPGSVLQIDPTLKGN